jgi:hypothetical protein
MGFYDKFIEKNKESIEKMDAYIDMNKETLRRIITSTELFYAIIEINNIEYNDGGVINYKGVTMGFDNYYPSNKVGFIFKNLEIEFDVPCVCGYYKGEGHNLK